MPLIHCHRRADDRSIFVLHGNDPVPPNHPFSETECKDSKKMDSKGL
jgi:hypothetical protein